MPDTRPRQHQIAADLRAKIMSGQLPAGTQLPSMPQLVIEYNAANATIHRALTTLKDEGFIYSRPGAGVYVRARPPLVIEAATYLQPGHAAYEYRLLDVADVVPPADVATALELDDGVRAVLRRRLLLHDGEPVELSKSYYPSAIAAGTALARKSKIRGGAPQVLAELGYPEKSFTDRISARPPTTDEVEVLNLPTGIPVLRQLRVIRSEADRPVEASILIKGGHLYELLYSKDITNTLH